MTALPLPVARGLKKLGSDMRDARRRRRIGTAIMAQRARISKPTLARLERGDPTVAMGIWATVLFVLGFDQALAEAADARRDQIGLELEAEALPKRITTRRGKAGTAS